MRLAHFLFGLNAEKCVRDLEDRDGHYAVFWHPDCHDSSEVSAVRVSKHIELGQIDGCRIHYKATAQPLLIYRTYDLYFLLPAGPHAMKLRFIMLTPLLRGLSSFRPTDVRVPLGPNEVLTLRAMVLLRSPRRSYGHLSETVSSDDIDEFLRRQNDWTPQSVKYEMGPHSPFLDRDLGRLRSMREMIVAQAP